MSQKRIVSLLPSCTEIVCALGCGSHLVGRSHECDYPPEMQALPACTAPRLDAGTGGAGINAVLLRKLRPSLILAQSQPGGWRRERGGIGEGFPARLPRHGPEIVSVAPGRLEDVWKDIQTIADAVGVSEEGRALLWRLKNRVVDIIEKTCMMTRRPAVACLEWLDPRRPPETGCRKWWNWPAAAISSASRAGRPRAWNGKVSRLLNRT